MTDPIDWTKCTCHQVWVGSEKNGHLAICNDALSKPVLTKVNPKCPEWSKAGHPR
jgi:hypothetical protein